MIKFSTKGQTLLELQPNLKSGKILPCVIITYTDWKNGNLDSNFLSKHKSLIVRSSCSFEDCNNQSSAGKYLSIAGITTIQALNMAVEKVFSSYRENLKDSEQVLIQPQLVNVEKCGVFFTYNQSNNSDYYVINYDTTGRTDSITSGDGKDYVTCYVSKNTKPKSETARELIALADELSTLLGKDNLDIEFAIDTDQTLWLLQVRPLVIKKPEAKATDEVFRAKKRIKNQINLLNAPHPYLYGQRSIFGVMPDWNPAEIIGVRPKPLSLSLYRELVTDNIWAYQRNNYGYLNLRSFPLLVSFCGQPYIDVRVSFNSFVPKDTPPELAEKLVDYYLDQLESKPIYHDKIEFNIVLSCYSLDMNNKMEKLRNAGFSDFEVATLSTSLRELTNRIIDSRTGLWIQDFHKIEKLVQRQSHVHEKITDIRQRIYWQLEDCKRYGTLPFAGLARAAFIAVQLLRSMVAERVLTEHDYERFMSSLSTVSSQMSDDFSSQSRSVFLEKYGHLRPGTYEITSPRYDAAPDLYFDWDARKLANKDCKFILSDETKRKCDELLSAHGISHSAISLFHFIKSAIEGREYAKFVFSKSLSNAIEDIAELCAQVGCSREDAAYLNIKDLQSLLGASDCVEGTIRESIDKGKRLYEVTRLLVLPPLISSARDVDEFELPASEPNFITDKVTTGQTCSIKNTYDLKRKIVFIPNADPGYDWIFSHDIKGLITQYGGCNSHMAIRASELGIPSVIGAGEILYKKWESAKLLEINAINRKVRVIR
ncbi:PEP-utilizing enzyme [Catenovulum sediminis]|uniref:PEP-utilizing enzyme n=1 Tax=Catenovulum sediminis TaxID=1740262 RepID=UPI001C8F9491|nr:PEP-utilizing enzyme [Catenovulum sediminis]